MLLQYDFILSTFSLLYHRKVFKKLSFELSEELIRDLVNAKPGTIELLLQMLKMKIERAEWEMRSRKNPPPKAQRGRRNDSDQPEADQNMGEYKTYGILIVLFTRYW